MTINMKKHSAFDNIPTLPRTFSGQWITFSHMANHYRKLLNVKPRVDTGIPHPFAPDDRKPQSKQIKGKHSKFERPATTECKPKSKWTRPRLASKMVDYEYHALSNGLIHSPNGSFNAGSSSDGYQVVFGPSSLKSSVDAMISDQEHEGSVIEPKVSSISIGEKIRKFLDNIHAQESQLRLAAGNRPLQNSRERKVPSKPKEKLVETRMNRHSNCFAPFEVSSPGTKKRSAKPSSSAASPSLLNHRCPTADSKRSAKTIDTTKVSANQRLTTINTKKTAKKTTAGAFQDTYSAFRTTNPGSRLSRKGSKKHMTSPNMSPRSVSVGTIHGSEELVEEFMVPSPSLPRNLSTFQIDTSDIPADWLKERVERGVVRINNAYFSLAPGTSTSSLGIHHSSSNHPNKDSSRDSAYGFSSGESRITTRESTPEKKSKATKKGSSSFEPNNNASSSNGNGHYKSSLSTVASSINQDNNNSRSQSHVNSSGRSSCSEKSILVPPPPPSNRYDTKNNEFKRDDKYDWMSDRKYIRFLTKVTDDIVTKGIYTNKGIKNIFKTHIMRNNELEMDKMLYLLERLRMDMGVPKDDSLNHLDFGYGSVDYSTEPYFYRKPEQHEEEAEEEEQERPENDQDNKSVLSAEESISDDNGNSIAD